MRPQLTYSADSVLIATAAGAALLLGTGWFWLWCWLLAINVVALGLYGWDKYLSTTDRFRIPEATLHTVAAVGGSMGALLGQRSFRHKIRKSRFLTIYWLTVAVQVAVAAIVWYFLLR